MTNESNLWEVRVSNWTLATGIPPGERYVYTGPRQYAARPPAPEDRP